RRISDGKILPRQQRWQLDQSGRGEQIDEPRNIRRTHRTRRGRQCDKGPALGKPSDHDQGLKRDVARDIKTLGKGEESRSKASKAAGRGGAFNLENLGSGGKDSVQTYGGFKIRANLERLRVGHV